jgi:hypothetical protein
MDSKFNIEEQLDYAIIEHGAIQHLKEYELRKQKNSVRRQLFMRVASYSAAACVVLAACLGGKESLDARRIGGSADISDEAKGGSVVVALMNDGNNKEALKQIKELRLIIVEEQASQDEWSDYEKQELDYLEAVCLLRQGRFISGRKSLKVIVSNNGYFADKARSLLEQL